MRRVLMIAYTFPPLAGVGIERTLKHVTYLPDNGWQPVVVAPANSAYRLIDQRTLDHVPAGTEVHRAVTVEPAHLRHAARRLVRGPAVARASVGGSPLPPASGLRGILNAAWRSYVELAFFPDEQILWAPAAIAAALAAHGADPVDGIYSSSPPVTGHLVAAAAARLTGRPWVADFRDPWIGNAYAHALPAPHRALRASVEHLLVRGATRSVFASAGVRDEYAARYPRLAHRFVVIHNGYDLDEIGLALASDTPARRDDRFRLIFTGSVQGTDEFELFADGMDLLLARDPALRDGLVVQFVGWFSPQVEAIARRRLPALGPAVERLGFQSKAATLGLLRVADAALVLLAAGPGREHVPSAKLFDYLGLSKPVLAVAPRGEVRRILDELGWGMGADPTPEGFADGVARLLAAPRPDREADPERRYERRTLSRRLAEVLDEVALRSSAPVDRRSVSRV